MISSLRDRNQISQHHTVLSSAASSPIGTPARSPATEQPPPDKEGIRRIQLDQLFAYRSLDKVSGSINHSGLLVDRIKVHLTGTAYISHQRFINGSYRNLDKSWEFLKLTKKLHLAPDASTTTLFGFRLPEALLETHCPLRNPFHLLIPPTIGCKRDDGLDDLSPKDPTNARIEYTIVAELFFENQQCQTFRKPFRVAPRHFSSPHTMNPPPGYDEVITAEADIHRSIGGKAGSLKIVRQTPPAVLSSLEEHQITTRVPLTVEFHSITMSPPKIQAIGIKLRAMTQSRTEHLLEGQEDVKRFTETRLNRLAFGKHTAPVWRPTRPGVWSSDIEIPVTLCPKGFVAMPEFESCLIDRHYALILKFEMSATSGLPVSETRLTIPVWIMADEYYGIPSEARPGVPVKQMRRFEVPQDVEMDGPGSLPMYEDTYLSNLANATQAGPVVVGDQGTRSAPFSLSGLEPDYFARPRAHAPRTAGSSSSGQGPSRPRRGSGRMTLEGIEPVEEQEEEDENARVPAWLQKELERPNHGSNNNNNNIDPREQDGAQ